MGIRLLSKGSERRQGLCRALRHLQVVEPPVRVTLLVQSGMIGDPDRAVRLHPDDLIELWEDREAVRDQQDDAPV